MGDGYSYVGAVVGATYPEQGKILRKLMPKTLILVPGYGAQGGQGKDLVHYFNEDGLGAIVNSSRGIICATSRINMLLLAVRITQMHQEQRHLI
jgi:orotidine-5'-phosphate decarboxylase